MFLVRIIAVAYRWILIIFNLGMIAFGIPVITVGVYLINKEKEFDWNGFYGHSVYTVGIGAYIMLSGFFGFYGAIRRNNRLLLIYSVAMATLCVTEMTMGIVNYIYGESNRYDLKSHLKKAIASVSIGSNSVVDAINKVYNDPIFEVLFDAATGEYDVFNIITLLTGTNLFQLWIAEMAFVYTCINED